MSDTKTTLLPAARLAEIREAFAAHDNGEAECDAQSLADFTRDLLAHIDALTAPADGEALGLLLAAAMNEASGIVELAPGVHRRYIAGARALYQRGHAAACARSATLLADREAEIARLTAERQATRKAIDDAYKLALSLGVGAAFDPLLALLRARRDAAPVEDEDGAT